MNQNEESYDVVIDVLTKHKNKLQELINLNMQSEYTGMNIMDQIRAKQIGEINLAIRAWKRYKNEL